MLRYKGVDHSRFLVSEVVFTGLVVIRLRLLQFTSGLKVGSWANEEELQIQVRGQGEERSADVYARWGRGMVTKISEVVRTNHH